MAVMERDLKVVRELNEKSIEQSVKNMWHYIDKDAAGDPNARWMAVSQAIKLRVSGVGPRKAALLFKRPIGDNGVQRYFDVARFFMEKLISQEEIRETGITGCAAIGRERFQKKHPSTRRRVDRTAKAKRMYQTIRAHITKAEKVFNIRHLLKMWATSPKGVWQNENEVKLV